MNINRNNYEEFFILYLDNELPAADRASVEAFAQAHPDLKEELDLLMQTKLVADDEIVFERKEVLLPVSSSSTMLLSNYEEWLLLYADNELDAAQKKEVEKFVAANPAVHSELNLLLKAKLQPEEITFPDKESLYRRESKTRPIFWWRMAAAAVLLLAVTSAGILMSRKKSNDPVRSEEIAKQGEEKKIIAPVNNNNEAVEQSLPELAEVNTNKKDDDNGADQKQQNDEVASSNDTKQSPVVNTPNKVRLQEAVDAPVQIAAIDANQKSQQATQPAIASNPIKVNDVINANNNDNAIAASSKVTANPQQQNTNSSPVTSLVNDTYHQVDAPVESDAVFASDNGGKKNKMRGFFRKITRTFEKTANIDATDNDDRLLVGGLAIRLK